MKKKVLLAMAVIMALGSIKAMAMTEEEAMDLNALTKTFAAEENMKAQESQSVNDADGKIMAVQIDEIEQVGKDIQDLISELGAEGSGLQENGLGQMDFLASSYEQEAKSSQNPDQVNNLWKKAMELKEQVSEIKAKRQ